MEKLYKNLIITAVIAFGGLMLVLIAARLELYTNIMMMVFFAGSIGAVVNNYYRLSRLSKDKDIKPEYLDRPFSILQMYVSLFLSGILGFVAYGLFMSGLLQGELFPTFSITIDNDYKNLYDFLVSVQPKTNADAAKTIVWAFISGFSERFIPNVLDTLVSKTEKNEKS